MKYLKILLGMMMCVFLFSCKNEENNFEGSWKLISYEKDGIAQVIADSTLNIRKKKTMLSANEIKSDKALFKYFINVLFIFNMLPFVKFYVI